jgi:hypothetical protein
MAKPTVISKLDELIKAVDALTLSVKSMHIDLKLTLDELIEKKAPITVEVKTSTAEEITKALQPITVELIRTRRRP